MSIIGVSAVETAAGASGSAGASGAELRLAVGDVVTPLAKERAAALGVRIVRPGAASATTASAAPPPRQPGKPLAANGSGPRGGQSRSAATLLLDGAAPRAADPRSVNVLYHRGLAAGQRTESTSPVIMQKCACETGVSTPGGRGRVAVIGAGNVGSIAALRLAEADLFDEVVLVDVLPGRAAGIALDLWHDAGLAAFSTRIVGSEDMSAICGSRYVIVTAGKPRRPGMTRTDLTAVNAGIVGPIAQTIAREAPDSVMVVVSNPLEEMTHLAQVRSGFPAERVLGMAGVLDSTRFCSLVGLTGVCAPADVHAFALGSHGPEMVIPLSQATVHGTPLTSLLPADQVDAIVERTRDSGAEVVKLLQSGSAYFAPGHSAALMVVTMATSGDRVLACAVEPAGAYDIRDTRVGLPVRLGPGGLRSVERLDLTPSELTELRSAADRLRERINEVA